MKDEIKLRIENVEFRIEKGELKDGQENWSGGRLIFIIPYITVS